MAAIAALFVAYAAYFIASISKLPVVTVENGSGETLRDVVLSGDGVSERIGAIGPHQSVARVVHAHGEVHLEIRFRAASGEVQAKDLAYLEESGGYTARIAIDGRLQVSGSYSQFKGY